MTSSASTRSIEKSALRDLRVSAELLESDVITHRIAELTELESVVHEFAHLSAAGLPLKTMSRRRVNAMCKRLYVHHRVANEVDAVATTAVVFASLGFLRTDDICWSHALKDGLGRTHPRHWPAMVQGEDPDGIYGFEPLLLLRCEEPRIVDCADEVPDHCLSIGILR